MEGECSKRVMQNMVSAQHKMANKQTKKTFNRQLYYSQQVFCKNLAILFWQFFNANLSHKVS